MHSSPLVLLAVGALMAGGLGLLLAVFGRSAGARSRGLSLVRWGLGVAGVLLFANALRDRDIDGALGGFLLLVLATGITEIGARAPR